MDQDKSPETEIKFDLAEELSAKELDSFKKKAKEAGAKTLTDHFKKVFFESDEKEVA